MSMFYGLHDSIEPNRVFPAMICFSSKLKSGTYYHFPCFRE